MKHLWSVSIAFQKNGKSYASPEWLIHFQLYICIFLFFPISLFHLTANPLLLEPTEVSPTVQLAPGILLTPYGVLQEVQERIKCADLIAAHSNELKFELDILQGNRTIGQLKAKLFY